MAVSWMPQPRTGTPTPFAGAAPSQADRDALALIKKTLADYGLPASLASWAWDEIVSGKGQAEVLLDLEQRPEFQAEYGAEMKARRDAGLAPLSVGEIISYRQQARQLMRAAGLPEGFYDSRDDFTNLLAKNVSLAELNDRIQQAKEATFNIPAEAKARLAERFGVTPGDGLLTSFFLDPDKALPLIQRDVNAARIGGRADLAGYKNFSTDAAAKLVDAGVSEGQAAQGFGELVANDELFHSMDKTEDVIGQEEQIGAAFLNNAQQQARIERRRRKRQAAFQGGGGFAETQRGVSGLGSSTT